MYKRVDLHDKPTPKFDMYMGRGNKWMGLLHSFWANPFVLKKEEERGSSLGRYEEYVRSKPEMIQRLPELFDNDLTFACWCTTEQKCHIDILYKLYLEFYPQDGKSAVV